MESRDLKTNLTQEKESFERILEIALSHASKFLNTLDERPAAVHAGPLSQATLTEKGLGSERALELLMQTHGDGFSGSAGPRYFGFVTGGVTPAAVAGDWLAAILDQNLASFGDSIAPHLTLEAIRMLRQLFGLPDDFTGAFVTGATMSNFCGLAMGRQWLGRQKGVDIAQQGLTAVGDIAVLSGTPHSSIFKALAMLGMGRDCLNTVATLPDREAVDLEALETRLSERRGEPCIVVANAGTVNTTDFDDFNRIAALRRKYDYWLHIDGAFGGVASCSPQYRHLLDGFEQADSITIDAHKWLNVPYDSGIIFTRHQTLQTEVFRNSAAYLGEMAETPDFLHLTPENSQRFRALPIWLALMAYGRDGFRHIVEHNCQMATWLAEKIEESTDFKLLAPVRLNVVCFTLNENQQNLTLERIQQYLHRLTEDGRVFLTQTVYKGKPAIRAAFSNWRTGAQDIEIAWQAMNEALT